jgi:hypothetical protein
MKAGKLLTTILLAMFSFSVANATPHHAKHAKHAKHHAKRHHKKHHAHHAHHVHHKKAS